MQKPLAADRLCSVLFVPAANRRALAASASLAADALVFDLEDSAAPEAVVAAFARPENAGRGVVRVGGRMAERLHLAQAERLLAAAGWRTRDADGPFHADG